MQVRKGVMVASAAVGWWLVSCKDIPAPEEGILSLSPVLLPSPALVAGDTMRDSLGLAAPLGLIAYGVNGDPVANPTVQFVVIDTNPGAHLVGSYLLGDRAGSTVNVIGSVEAIQTRPVTLKVTLRPDTLLASDSIVQRKNYSLVAGDTVADLTLNTTATNRAAGTGVDGVIVTYAIERSPAGVNNAPTVQLLVSKSGPLSDRDTTDSGLASRVARLRTAVKTTFTTDTALISATASYAGHTLGRVLFTLIYTSQ